MVKECDDGDRVMIDADLVEACQEVINDLIQLREVKGKLKKKHLQMLLDSSIQMEMIKLTIEEAVRNG